MKTTGFTIKTTREVTREQVANLLCSAFEGGSNYWYRIEKKKAPSTYQFRTDPDTIYSHIDYPLNPDGYLIVSDFHGADGLDEIVERKLNYASIKRGLQLMAEANAKGLPYGHHWNDFITDNDDQTTADVFLQFCLFGEVIYG